MLRSKRNQRGNIMISALWVIVAMVILVLGIGFEARSDIERTTLFRDRSKAYWLARAAIERVKYDWAISQLRADPDTEKKSRFHYTFQEGGADCEIQSQSGLMSVNSNNRELWAQLLGFYGLEGSALDEVVDAIFDWRDSDDLERLNGAEADYYQSLTPPYLPRNGPFFSVEEILLVRGISEEMFYGSYEEGKAKPGLKEVLSLSPSSIDRFDINSSPAGILMAFLGISAEEADIIVKARGEKLFETVQDAGALVSLEAAEKLERFFYSNQGQHFTIKATAFVDNSPARYTVEEEVRYTGGGKLYAIMSHKDFSLEHVKELAAEGESE